MNIPRVIVAVALATLILPSTGPARADEATDPALERTLAAVLDPLQSRFETRLTRRLEERTTAHAAAALDEAFAGMHRALVAGTGHTSGDARESAMTCSADRSGSLECRVVARRD